MAFKDTSIYYCAYCGERCNSKAKHCPTCRTQKGRKAIFDANVEILKENKAKGYEIPIGLKNWK